MRIILTGGGTGGHINTALALGEKFREKDPHCEILYIGTSMGKEKVMLPESGLQSQLIELGWFYRSKPKTIFNAIRGAYKGIRQVRKIVKDFQPDFVFSSGAFAGVPAILAAMAEKIPFYLHDQNYIPGKANRLFSKKARIMFIGVNDARKYFKKSVNVFYTGNPVRKAFYDRDRALDRAAMGIPQDDMVITTFCGSNGSFVNNHIGFKLIKEFGNKAGYRINFIIGTNHYSQVIPRLDELGLSGCDNVLVFSHINNMPQVMSASDIIVCYAGTSRSEIAMVGRAAILIAANDAVANHQFYNAKEFVDKGAAVRIMENEAAPELVLKEIRRLDGNRQLILTMEKASHRLAPKDAPDMIYDAIMKTYQNPS